MLQVTGFAMQLLRDREVLDMLEVRAMLARAVAQAHVASVASWLRGVLAD